MVIIYMSRQSEKKDLDVAIRAAGKRRDVNSLVDAYHRATAQGQYQHHPYLADVVTLNIAITVAGNNQRLDLAEDAFRIALARNQADVVTHGNINDARQKNRPPLGTRFRHNPYSFTKSWEIDNTPPRLNSVSSGASSMTLRQ